MSDEVSSMLYPCTIRDVILPIEYSSKEDLLKDFEAKVELHMSRCEDNLFEIGGHKFDHIHFYGYDLNKKVIILPEAYTLEEWFDAFKGEDHGS